jgi:thiamine kinase
MARSRADSSLFTLIAGINPALKIADCHISLVSGLTGENWHITAPNINWLVREQSMLKSQLGVNRRRERKLLRHVASSDLSPAIIAANQHWLVINWLEGDVVTDEQFIELADNGRLAQLVACLHHLPASGYRLDVRGQLIRYGQLIDPARCSPGWLRLQRDFLRKPLPQPVKLAPLHMDIHPENLLITSTGLKLIDWEYAADGDIALDIAALFRSNKWFRGNNWSTPQQHRFLQHYCLGEQGYSDIKRLSRQIQRWLPWVDYLMLMWFEVRWQQTGDVSFLQWATPLRQRFNLSF